MLGDRWGVTTAETLLPFPCDDLVGQPRWQAWRGVSVRTTPDRVWPWIRQIRLAPYSYDWIDNLGRRSPRQLVDLPDPVVGDPFTATAGRPQGKVVAVEPGRSLTARIMGVHMSYLLEPEGEGGTRLLLKIVGRGEPLFAMPLVLGDLVMARRQLLNLKRRAEGFV
ncbi:MAG: hypothetical protein ACTHJM_02225 [Marmoricola sp.]